MSDLLKAGSAWLEGMRQRFAASSVEYRRSSESLTVLATFGRTRFEVADESGFAVKSQIWDFLIARKCLPFEPQTGDEIIALGRRYLVTNIPGDGAARFSDPYRETWRIHTREIGGRE